jgi:hypothetical protein
VKAGSQMKKSRRSECITVKKGDALVGCILAAHDLKLPIPTQMERLLRQPVER